MYWQQIGLDFVQTHDIMQEISWNTANNSKFYERK